MTTILIIDDSPTELHLFQNMLEKGGFETLVAESASVFSAGPNTAEPIITTASPP